MALSRRYDRQLWLERSAVAIAMCLLAPAPHERLLDVGTGTGEVLRQLARRSIVPREVTGIDASEAMLARVGPLHRGWLLRVGDVRALDLPDASFDVLISSYLLQLLAPVELPAALGELRRVRRRTRPTGRARVGSIPRTASAEPGFRARACRTPTAPVTLEPARLPQRLRAGDPARARN